jgi:hypothetical protein
MYLKSLKKVKLKLFKKIGLEKSNPIKIDIYLSITLKYKRLTENFYYKSNLIPCANGKSFP